MMGDFVKVAETKDIQPSKMIAVEVDGEWVEYVISFSDALFAFSITFMVKASKICHTTLQSSLAHFSLLYVWVLLLATGKMDTVFEAGLKKLLTILKVISSVMTPNC